MLRAASYDIVFQELPGEVTLAINLSNCPHHCKGCHSPHLRQDVGECLDNALLSRLIANYGHAITCVCFMGGDAAPQEVEAAARYLRRHTHGRIKTGWYSGRDALPDHCASQSFDYIKLGAYIQSLGGLNSPRTNQRLYRIDDGHLTDITHLFWEAHR